MTVWIVRQEDDRGEYIGHRIFSSQELATKHLEDNAVAMGHKYRLIEREAAPQAVAELKRKGL